MKSSRMFTRQEVILLADCTSSRLASLEKSDLVVPIRLSGAVFFSWEHVIGIRMIKCLRSGLSLRQAKTILDFLFQQKLLNSKSRLALLNDQPLWVPSGFIELPEALKTSFTAEEIFHYDLFLTPPLVVFVQQVKFAAHQHNLIETINSRLSKPPR